MAVQFLNLAVKLGLVRGFLRLCFLFLDLVLLLLGFGVCCTSGSRRARLLTLGSGGVVLSVHGGRCEGEIGVSNGLLLLGCLLRIMHDFVRFFLRVCPLFLSFFAQVLKLFDFLLDCFFSSFLRAGDNVRVFRRFGRNKFVLLVGQTFAAVAVAMTASLAATCGVMTARRSQLALLFCPFLLVS